MHTKCYSCKQKVSPEVFNQQYNYCPKCGGQLYKPMEE